MVPPRQAPHIDRDAEAAGAVAVPEPAPELAPEPAVPGIPASPFLFEKLPGPVQVQILELLLVRPGQLVHCISRLDPFVEPAAFPSAEDLGENRSGYRNLFFWGARECSITHDGVDPNQFLAVLGVNHRLLFLGSHIFYGANTFAFSSLGELGRFMQGTGLARIARMQHIELVLTGSQHLVSPPDSRGLSPFSRRTFPLTWLTELPRLKTLVIHINETGKQYVRRKVENPAIKKFMAAKTAGQPNTRMTRSLRCVQGLDHIYELRGLKFVKLYDFQKALDGGGIRVPVRDWSFREDVSNQVTMPKVPKREEQARLENLEPLVPEDQNWRPSADDWELVKPVFIESNGRCSYDDLRARQPHRDADMASFLSGSVVVDISSSSEDSSEDDSESSDSSGDGSDDDSGSSGLFVSGADQVHEQSGMDSDSESSPGSSLSHPAIILSDSSDDAGQSSSDSSSDSDSDSPSNGSNKSVSQILSSRGASFSPLSRLTNPNNRRASTASSGLFMTPNPSSRLGSGARTTFSPKRRESTGLFVTPGPSGRVETPRLQQAEAEGGNGRVVVDLSDDEGFQPLGDFFGSDDEGDPSDGDGDGDSSDGELELLGGRGSGLKRSWSGGSQGSRKLAKFGA